MKRSAIKRFSKRLISCMLLVVMLTGSFYSYAANVTISEADRATALDVVTGFINDNLAPYGCTTDSSTVQTAVIDVGKELGYAKYFDVAEGKQYEENITLVPLSNVMIEILKKFNDTNGWNEDGTSKKTTVTKDDGSTEEVDVEHPAAFAKFSNTDARNYTGGSMSSTYNIGVLIRDYTRKHEPSAGNVLDESIDVIVKKYVTTDNLAVSMSTIMTDVQAKAAENNTGEENFNDKEYIDSFMNPHTVTYATYVQNHVVQPSTLFIGTYLIDANVINDVYYRYAKDTMGLHNQQIMLYKSELDGGHWKDIISAVGLSDILPSSESLQDAELAAYKVTCVIGSDGIPRYPDDDTEADIFSMTNPYDMAAIPELLPLKTLFEAGAVSQDTSDISNRYAADCLYRFFNYDGTGDNTANLIIRNKAYRDYLYDHPNQKESIIGTGSVPMNATVNITEEEVRYVTGLADKMLRLDANMPQTLDRYPGHNEAFFDQMLAWAEYYATDHAGKFSGRLDANGIPRPIILPGENFTDSGWEVGFRNTDWYNQQSYMYILNGGVGSADQKEFIDRWCADSVLNYRLQDNSTQGYNINSSNWNETTVNDISAAAIGIQFRNGTGATSDRVSVAWGRNWNVFCDLIYRYMDWMRNMYDIRDEETYECDQILEELNALYKQEIAAERTANADTLMRLMSRVDAKRRAKIYYNLVYNEDHNYVVGPTLLYLVGLLQSGKGHLGQNFAFISGAEETNFASQDAVLTVAEDAVTNCQNKYSEYASLAFGEGTTVIKEKEYELSNTVMNASNAAERQAALTDLALVYNIEEGAIVDKAGERRVLDELMETAGDNYAASIHDVAGEDYLIAAADPATSKGALKTHLEMQKADADGDVAQLQNMIKGYALRLNTSEGIMFINRRLDWAEAQADGIQTDDPFGPFAGDSLKEHIDWLKKILKEVKNGTLNGNDPIEDPDLKVVYQGQMLDSLDNNDLEGAEGYEAEIKKLDAAGSGSGNEGADGSGAGAGSGEFSGANGDVGELINDLHSEILSDPNDTDRVPEMIEALGHLGDPNIGDLQDLMDRYDADKASLDALEGAILNAKNSEINPSDTGDGDSGKEDGNGLKVSDEDLRAAIESALGKGFGELDDDDKAAIVAACTRFYNDRNIEDIMSFGRRVQTQALGEDNPYFYHQFVADPTTQYVSLAAVDRARRKTNLRYSKLGRKITMSRYGKTDTVSLTFVIGSKDVISTTKTTDASGNVVTTVKDMDPLTKNAVQQADDYIRGSLTNNYGYIPEPDSTTLLSITCEYVPKTEYAVYITTSIQSKAVAIYEAIDDLVTRIEEDQEAAPEGQGSQNAQNSESNTNNTEQSTGTGVDDAA